MTRQQKLKKIEELVLEASGRLKRAADENKKLRAELSRLQTHAADLEAEVRRLSHFGARQERLRGRIERLVQKLDKAVDLAG